MKKVLLALFVLGMSATSHAVIVLDTGRHGTATVNVTGLKIVNGNLVVSAAKGGGFVLDYGTLRTAGVSAVEMVNVLTKYNESKDTLKITGSSYLEGDYRYLGGISLNF